jgi:hypothetical protein
MREKGYAKMPVAAIRIPRFRRVTWAAVNTGASL